MKSILALALCLTLALDSHAQTNEVPLEKRAMVSVARARQQLLILTSRIVVDRGQVVQWQVHPAEFVAVIKKLKTDTCPQNFQLAWFDYITDREEAARKAQRAGGEALVDLVALARGGSAALAGLKDLDRIGEESAGDAWRKVERVALEDGVDLTKL